MVARPLALLVLMTLSASARVILLQLGDAAAPALLADGSVVTSDSFPSVRIGVFDTADNYLGDLAADGLDTAGSGFLVGAVDLGQTLSTARLKLIDIEAARIAELGQLASWTDPFLPMTDPSLYRLQALTLSWRGFATHTLTTAASGLGTVAAADGVYAEFDSVMITATPAPLREFLGWQGELPVSDQQLNPLTLVMSTDRALTATFGVSVPDQWRYLHFGTTEVDLDADPDSDGITTRDEFAHGTDPDSAATTTQMVALRSGWSLLAVPVQPSPETTWATMLGADAIGWAWDDWRQCLQPAAEVSGRRGCWVFAPTAAAREVAGQPLIDTAWLLQAGWNLVTVSAAMPVPTATDLSPAWQWQSALGRYQLATELRPGQGYWIHAADAILLMP